MFVGRIMAAHLSLTATLLQFSSFLLETIGIEENVYTVQEARASANSGSSAWAECCASWREHCALASTTAETGAHAQEAMRERQPSQPQLHGGLRWRRTS